MEHFDPLGIHTGVSIVAAPSQNLSDDNYHMLRTAALKVIRHFGIVGECNIQYALSPDSREYRVIEVNPRLRRSRQIAHLVGANEVDVRRARKAFGITPWVKPHDVEFDDQGTMVLGSGVYRIRSSVEFPWCAVTCARWIRGMGHKTIMINYNPETVSTDFDEADRLYFEELGFERVMDIYELERATGVVVSVGGQLPQNIALRLKDVGVKVLGTDPLMIDSAEDRHKFSYVLSGAAMNVVWDESTLEHHLTAAAQVNTDYPVAITKFIDGAQEIDVDAVAHKGKLIVHAVSEHVENAGLSPRKKVAKAFKISGPFNMQVIRKPPGEGETEAPLKVIECNLRASRSFPFVIKVLGKNFVDIATCAIVDQDVPEPMDLMQVDRDYVAVKASQFSWTRLAGADPSSVLVSRFDTNEGALSSAHPSESLMYRFQSPEMASTGEVAAFGKDIYEAYWASIAFTTGFRVPEANKGVLLRGDVTKPQFVEIAKKLCGLGSKLYCSNAEVGLDSAES
ncbi:unnamed protein product, partial [Tilletia caries]